MSMLISILILAQLSSSTGLVDKIQELTLVRFPEAVEAASQGKFEEANTVFVKVAEYRPYQKDALLYIQICTDAINGKVNNEAAEYLFKSLVVSKAKGEISEELLYLNRAFGLQRNYAPTFIIRGKFYLRYQKYKFALQEFTTAIQLAKMYHWAHYYRGKAYLQLNEKEKALRDFNNSLRASPFFTDGLMARASLYFSLGKMDRALTDYITLRNINPDMTKSVGMCATLNDIGIIYKGRKETLKAITAFDEAVLADDRWHEPFLNRGIAYRSLEKYPLAIEDFNKAIELMPENAEGYYNRGLTYKKSGDYKNAESDLNKATVLDEDYEKAYLALGETYLAKRKFDEAIFNFQKLKKINKDNFWVDYWLGLTFDKAKKYSKAIDYYKKFVGRLPKKYFQHKTSTNKRIKELQKLR
jgi:tetratricopeptide (TPR) repeat protein